MHGWLPAYHNVHPAIVALHKKPGQEKGYDYQAQIDHEKERVWQWVSRPDQEAYLRAHGYRHVHAIGLPFGYLPTSSVERVPGSLLVMPPHGQGNHGPNDPVAEAYAEAIACKRRLFSEIVVCLCGDDVAGRQWITSFEKRGIPVVIGADQSEPETLFRLKRLLSRFEYVTTNGFGSQIAYAACCGAKVSVYGPFVEFPMSACRAVHAAKMFPELAEVVYGLCSETSLKQHYSFLFTEPENAVPRVDWAWREIGGHQLLSPEAMKEVLTSQQKAYLSEVC
jgi:hypothetical protein